MVAENVASPRGLKMLLVLRWRKTARLVLKLLVVCNSIPKLTGTPFFFLLMISALTYALIESKHNSTPKVEVASLRRLIGAGYNCGQF